MNTVVWDASLQVLKLWCIISIELLNSESLKDKAQGTKLQAPKTCCDILSLFCLIPGIFKI
jgi:hypothetical protein